MKCYAIENHPNDSRITVDQDGIVQTLSTRMGTGGNNTPFVLIDHNCSDVHVKKKKAYCCGNGQLDNAVVTPIAGTLDCMHDQKIVLLEDDDMESDRKYVLRRLTPIECARLQGFPDWWCDGANGSDSAQYKLWGNGVALPCVAFILGNIAEDTKDGKE